jgi:hypothetical protein
MKKTGLFIAEKVKYDKVLWNRNVSIPGSYNKYNFKIVELKNEFYIFMDDKYPNLLYYGKMGPFNTFEEAINVLENDLGSDFPSIKNKVSKSTRALSVILFCIIYIVLNFIVTKFIDGGLDAIGISDSNYIINGFIMLILNGIALNRIGRRYNI